MKIFHAADLHLGRRRLDGRLPDSDFADAFEHIARAAITGHADVFLLAGDLFDRPQVEPPHLRQAQRVLALLKEARIPVIAIEGNHEKSFLHSEAPTWLDYLAQDELLILLRTTFDAAGPLLAPWDPATQRGAWIDLGGVRFTGAGYLGAATPHKVRQIVAQLEAGRTHVLLLHAGPDYFVGEGGGFSADDLRLIQEKVRYLALGHIHKPMLHGDWACNPGSPENCELRETLYDRDAAGHTTSRGYACIELEATGPARIRILSNPRRPCFQLDLDCTPFGHKLKDGAGELEKAAVRLITGHLIPPGAALELRLIGRMNLNRIAFDAEALSRILERETGLAAVCLNTTHLEGCAVSGAGEDAALSREELERAALRRLVEGEHLWGLEGEQETAADLFYALKEAVRTGRLPQELADTICTSALVEKIRIAQSLTRASIATPTAAAEVAIPGSVEEGALAG
ncbi:MAG: repair protein SbcD/Mre11 [Chthoniobacter sp.]|nr:repair protein SbcD/Mre11 [Chthoniobacter sp.]